MAKVHSSYVCQQCGYASSKWYGKCPECESWGSLVETIVSTKAKGSKFKATSETKEGLKPVSIASISSRKTSRASTKIPEFDRVLGGGVVSGQVSLIAGEPGIGKSTILLQLAEKIGNVLYISGEESVNQIALRGKRLGIKKKTVLVVEDTDIDRIISLTFRYLSSGQPLNAVVIDSIQTMSTTDLSGMAGSVGQVRECAYRLVRLAKSTSVAVFIVGHITKVGAVAGPAVLSHLVDTLLWFEGDKSLTLRLLRAVKNRFGPTDEVGIFTMEDKGLVSISNPEKIFLSGGRRAVAGNVASSIMQGLRPILIEVQSLVISSKLAFPKRVAQGIDAKRLELLIAVLVRRCGLPLYEHDCFVNIAGGISAKDPSVDLATCLSLASTFFDKPIEKKSIAIGEVGLLGEIREVSGQDRRIKEARRLGYSNIISSKTSKYLNQVIKRFVK